MGTDDLHRILFKGGVTSPGELKDSIAMLKSAGLNEVYFGSRQDLLFPLKANLEIELESESKFNTDIINNRNFQNIVSSYVSADIFEMTYWLKGSTYLYILEQFDYLPELKINITDPKQRLVPIFNGNLNFIASEQEDYWYLHINPSHWTKAEYLPVLIYSWDIVNVSKALEAFLGEAEDIDSLFYMMNQRIDTNSKTVDKPLEIPYLTFPYYEGMNRMGSFIIKGIKQQSRIELERFLGQWGINVRHSQLEMNWHLPVDDNEALELKKFLVRSFDQNDISTYGLTFGISNDVGKRSHFSSVVIEKNQAPKIVKNFDVRPTYNVLYFKNFDPNTITYNTYAQDVDKIELPGLLMELSKQYFEQLGKVRIKGSKDNKKEELLTKVYQCSSCMTIYDETVGDVFNNISPKTAFNKLPDSFSCSVCNGPKTMFVATELKLSVGEA